MKDRRLRIVFMGTPRFAVPSLQKITETEEVTLVVTNPDRPRGRGRKVVSPPVKDAAYELGIQTFQPVKIRENPEAVEKIESENPDIIVVIAYGKILPPSILEIPPLGCINIHASILPRYRGAAPINWAIMEGETMTGVSIMKMDEGMDTGPVLFVKEERIEEEDTALSLSERLSRLGAEAIGEALTMLKEGRLRETPQKHEEATYAPMLKKEMGLIDWREPAGKIRNLVRGLFPWPGAFTIYKGRTLQVLSSRIEDFPLNRKGEPGEVLEARKDGILVACGEGQILLERVKPEGKKEIHAWDFVQGYRVAEGLCLGT